jgi:glycerol-3-phosphate dehydrogenase
MKLTFSAHQREDVLKQMASGPMDILVIGGGITGAGIALDASQRGMNVGLVEKADFASGTSSRSTKLIHGGLRYLKQGEVQLVREVGKERAILHRNAPHVVKPVPMILPIYKGGSLGYWATSIGLYIYDLLAGVARKERRIMLSREETLRKEPLLQEQGLKGAGLYYEYRTDDARLTLEISKTAWKQGAKLVNYTEATEFIYRDGTVIGVKVNDCTSGQTYELYAKTIVNAGGPWVDGIRRLDGSMKGKRLFLTKGVHLVVDYKRLPVKQSAYFDTPDGRMVFVIPRGKSTYIGTTDTAYDGLIDEPRTTKEDRDYLLNAVNDKFPEVQLKAKDVLSHWAGLRPLIYEEGKGPSELSRKDEIFISDSGLITIAGGKLTGFRKMAEKVVNLVAKKLNVTNDIHYANCLTDQLVISGGEMESYPSFEELEKAMISEGIGKGLSQKEVSECFVIYGSNTSRIFSLLDSLDKDVELCSSHNLSERFLRAQLAYSIEEEMTLNAIDFLIRRTGWILFDIQKAEELWKKITSWMGEYFDWDAKELQKQQQWVQDEIQRIRQFPDHDKGKSLIKEIRVG